MGRKAKKRRQSHGSAWHWKQTDCWHYFTIEYLKSHSASRDNTVMKATFLPAGTINTPGSAETHCSL